MINFLLLWSLIYYINNNKSVNPLKTRPYLSLVHSIISIVGNLYIRYHNSTINYQHTNLELITFNWSIGYFLLDSILSLYHKKYIYGLHHIISLFGIIFNIYSKNNAGLVSLGLLLGELINPMLNITNILNNSDYKKIYILFLLLHRLLFFIIRIIYIPIIYYRLRDKINNDYYDKYIYSIIGIILYIGSIYWWIYQLIDMKIIRQSTTSDFLCFKRFSSELLQRIFESIYVLDEKASVLTKALY